MKYFNMILRRKCGRIPGMAVIKITQEYEYEQA
jgi:hypothetical protein